MSDSDDLTGLRLRQIILTALVLKLIYIVDAAFVSLLLDRCLEFGIQLASVFADVVKSAFENLTEIVWAVVSTAQIALGPLFVAIVVLFIFARFVPLPTTGQPSHLGDCSPKASTSAKTDRLMSTNLPGEPHQGLQPPPPTPRILAVPDSHTTLPNLDITKELRTPEAHEEPGTTEDLKAPEFCEDLKVPEVIEDPKVSEFCTDRLFQSPVCPPANFTTTREPPPILDDTSEEPSTLPSPLSPTYPLHARLETPPLLSLHSTRKEPVKHPTATPMPTPVRTAEATAPVHYPKPTFPKPSDFSMPGEFSGSELTYWLEIFEDALDEQGITQDKEIVKRWLRWCDRETRDTVKDLWAELADDPATQTWPNLQAAMRKEFKFLDPQQQDQPLVNIRRFYQTKLGWTADEVAAGLKKLKKLLNKFPSSSKAHMKKEATGELFAILDPEIHAIMEAATGKDIDDLPSMDFEEFSKVLHQKCRAGYTVHGQFTKFSPAKDDQQKPPTQPAGRRTKAAGPCSTELVTVPKRDVTSTSAIDDLSSQIAKLTILMGSHVQKDQEALKTYYQQPPAQTYNQPVAPPSAEELQTNFMRTGRFNPQMGGSQDGQVYMGNRNAYDNRSGGNQGSYFVSNESMMSGQPRRVPMLQYDQTRSGRPMTRYVCHGCGDPSHRCFPNQCPEYGAIEYFSLGYLRDGFLYIGRLPPSPQSLPDSDMMVFPALLRQAQQAGAIWQLVVAIYQRFQSDLPTYPNFTDYLIKKERTNFVAPISFLQVNGQDPPWILQGKQFGPKPTSMPPQAPMSILKADGTTAGPSSDGIQTNISRVEDRGRPLFDYLDKGDVRIISYRKDDETWIQQAFPNNRPGNSDTRPHGAKNLTTAHSSQSRPYLQLDEKDLCDLEFTPSPGVTEATPEITPPPSLPPPDPPKVPKPSVPVKLKERPLSETPPQRELDCLENIAVDALTMLSEADPRKRPRYHEPVSSSDADSPMKDRPISSAPASAESHPILPSKPRKRPAPTSLPSDLLEKLAPQVTQEKAVTEIIASLLGKQIQVPLRQLLALNGGLVNALQTFLEAQQHVDDVITLTDTGVPEPPARHGESPEATTHVNLVSNVNTTPSEDKVLHDAIPFFATLAHGELALMNADVLKDFLTLRQRRIDPLSGQYPEYHTAVEALSLRQKAAFLLATRYHHLPRMFLHLGDQSTKVCAIIDTGSECNLIPRSVVDTRGIPWTPTATVSIGLHGKESFTGECITNVWFGELCVKTHFFILDDRTRDYELILGMPFIRDTKLTFEYMESGTIRAKVILDNKMILASCFSPALSKSD